VTAPAPLLEPRSAEELLAALHARLPAYLPAWRPAPGGPGEALLAVYAGFLRALAERINAAPAKNELAFLDLLGIDVLPTQAARTPVVFRTIAGAGNGRASAGTRLGAKGPDPTTPVPFQTEQAVGLAQARLAEVVTVWPGRDAYADHTADALGGRPFTLWKPLAPVRHELYLAHDQHFALSGQSSVQLQLGLAPGGAEPLELEWEWWDGKAWRAFKSPRPNDQAGESFDGTRGLTRSGAIRLVTDCGEAKPTTVGGWSSYWLRGRLTRRLPSGTAARPAELDRVSVRTVVERLVANDCKTGLLPDHAFADGTELDFTKTAYPLGQVAGHDSAFYLALEEAFSRPGATVTVCVRRAVTPNDAIDAELAKYELGVDAARKIVEDIRKAVADIIATLEKLEQDELPQNFDDLFDDQKLELLIKKTQTALDALLDMADPAALVSARAAVASIPGAAATIISIVANYDLALALSDLLASPPQNLVGEVTNLGNKISAAQSDIDTILDPNTSWPARITAANKLVGAAGDLIAAWGPVANHLTQWSPNRPATTLVDATLTPMVARAKTLYETVKNHIKNTRKKLVDEVVPALKKLKLELDDLSPITVAAAANVLPPKLDDPKLVWEYWDGREWQVRVPASTSSANNLLGSGSFTFTVPADWEPSEHASVTARWLRARLASGSYARVRLVSWVDVQTKEIKFMAVVEPRPPALDALRLGYHWESPPAPPTRCLTLNEARWQDTTAEAAGHGGSFVPFSPMEDATPALYLGFDGPLPADRLGLLVDVEETPGLEQGPTLVWERWDGARWSRVRADDETAHLAGPGIVSVLWPGDEPPAVAVVVSASAQSIVLADEREAARYASGDLVWLEAKGKGELATVDGVSGNEVVTAAPLGADYGQGTLRAASLPRFGTPRTWLRARLSGDGEPLRARVRGLHPNAVWAAQLETVEGELLGSSTGEPRQVFFFARTPALAGEVVEVRELEGERAHVEYPLLVEAVAAEGIPESELRVERNPRTGRVSEVWVPWRGRPSLAFSGPRDRDYTAERTRGRLLFGDGIHGAVPPAGADNIRARRYRTGGGAQGNLGAGAVRDVLGGVLVEGVTSPLPAEGGADAEWVEDVLERGPLTIRHRRQAVTAADAEALAREGSPAVALARALPRGTGVGVAIVPRSPDPRPLPSLELRREVRSFLRARAPASLAGALEVVEPTYVPVGVAAVIAPLDPAAGGLVVAAAREALERFLHPLTGGPGGTGWPFGRGVYLSDVAALLEGLAGIDYVESLALVVAGSPQGTGVEVPPDRLVCAGAIDVELGGER
jgi:Baseplate J-like protein